VPTRYFAEASSVNFRRSVVYGLATLRTLVQHRQATAKSGWASTRHARSSWSRVADRMHSGS
jgi:hypothetical protein